ncbi:hypothetical protein ACFSKU_02870 [Pontibacter silvestris]|uniref:Uncharacterized protein n=1 Tax=Pontibacter silvestris TaxID=2305183 RepID=A0ABW4WV16_9BACT|nr:hypothetical protein [Pontibacter silvestris]MCC9138420.1 hypothetical protein [Pontibacter silvestris]
MKTAAYHLPRYDDMSVRVMSCGANKQVISASRQYWLRGTEPQARRKTPIIPKGSSAHSGRDNQD